MKSDPRSCERNLCNCVKKPEKLKQLESNFFLCDLCVPNILAKVAKSVQKTELSSINDYGKSNAKLSHPKIDKCKGKITYKLIFC